MEPIGYVVSRHTVRADRPVKAYQRWINRLPEVYATSVLGQSGSGCDPDNDPNLIARLKDYRSLMPIAQEKNKPMFFLKPADGAIGGHQAAVLSCYQDFRALAQTIAQRAGLNLRA